MNWTPFRSNWLNNCLWHYFIWKKWRRSWIFPSAYIHISKYLLFLGSYIIIFYFDSWWPNQQSKMNSLISLIIFLQWHSLTSWNLETRCCATVARKFKTDSKHLYLITKWLSLFLTYSWIIALQEISERSASCFLIIPPDLTAFMSRFIFLSFLRKKIFKLLVNLEWL